MGIPRKVKTEAKAEVEKTIAEIEEPEGEELDKHTVAGHLKNATETLKRKNERRKTMEASVTLRRKIVDFFTSIPGIYDPGKPQALIQNAGLDPQLRNQINFGSSPGQFFQLLLPTLSQYGTLQDGRHALQAVLESAKGFLGEDGRTACDDLIRELGWIPEEYQDFGQKFTSPETETSENRGGQTVNITVGGNAVFDGVSIGDGGTVVSKVKEVGNIVQAKDSTVTIAKIESFQQGMSLEEVVKLFEQLQTAVSEMESVSRKAKIEARAEVEKAIAEVEEPEGGQKPDKETIAGHLKNAAETLKAAGATALQATSFGKLVAQAVDWLGESYQ